MCEVSITLVLNSILDHLYTYTLNSEFAIKWSLKVPLHVKTSAAVTVNSQADINISQGILATHLKCGGIFSDYLVANLVTSVPVKEF